MKKTPLYPPGFSRWILKHFFRKEDLLYRLDDFDEVYDELCQKKGISYAKRWYRLQVIKSIPQFLNFSLFRSFAMLKNYFLIVLRNSKKQKGYTFINISGLAIGMTCFILLSIYLKSELSYDAYHNNRDKIYRLVSKITFGDDVQTLYESMSPTGDLLSDNIPEILKFVRFGQVSRTQVSYNGSHFLEEKIFYSDNSVFDIFTFEFISGNPKTALSKPYTIVITENTAKKYFGNKTPIGERLIFNNDKEYTVTGIIKNVPQNSHFVFDMLGSFETLRSEDKESVEQWGRSWFPTYILSNRNINLKILESKIQPVIDKNFAETYKSMGGTFECFLQPLDRIYLYTPNNGVSRIVYIYIFSIIALFILLIACINFMNLSTARYSSRAREIGIRKVAGATRAKLIKQFLADSILFSLVSMILAIIIVKISSNQISLLIGYDLRTEYFNKFILIFGPIVLTLFVGICAGSYPAFFLSNFQPVKVFKGNIAAGASNHKLRNFLVITQFTISIALIFSTIIIFKQLKFLKHKELGFNKEHVMVLNVTDKNSWKSYPAFKNEILNNINIRSVSASSTVPGQTPSNNVYLPEGFPNNNTQQMSILYTDKDFFKTLDINLTDGRNFSENTEANVKSIIVNETAVKNFGWKNPLGKFIKDDKGLRTSNTNEWKSKNVIGVINDFFLAGLFNTINPLYIYNDPGEFEIILIRISPENISRTIDYLESKWNEIFPQKTFEYLFLDNIFNKQFINEDRIQKIFFYFTGLAIFIACLGLFGLASYTAEKKSKEIGIRKVMGASIKNIVFMLSWKFIKPVMVSALIVLPPAVYLAARWLTNFAYKTQIDVNSILFTFVLTILITFLAVGYQAVRASLTNPIKCIKSE